MIKETLPFMRYAQLNEVPSKIDPKFPIEIMWGIQCPKCRKQHPCLPDGKSITCGKCGLRMKRNGKDLECELDN